MGHDQSQWPICLKCDTDRTKNCELYCPTWNLKNFMKTQTSFSSDCVVLHFNITSDFISSRKDFQLDIPHACTCIAQRRTHASRTLVVVRCSVDGSRDSRITHPVLPRIIQNHMYCNFSRRMHRAFLYWMARWMDDNSSESHCMLTRIWIAWRNHLWSGSPSYIFN